MNTETREYVKIGLLGVIALCLVYGTFFKKSKAKRSLNNRTVATAPVSQNQNPLDKENLSLNIDPNKPEGSASSYLPTTIQWTNGENHDFGNIKQHTENNHVFTFTNTGNEPLIITNAEGSCGCTVPDYPKQPIAPGESGEIKVKYSPGTQIGQQTKTVTIQSNAEPGAQTLYINAMVEEAPDPLLDVQ